ncbi:MAG: tRNA (N6-isopentenyl adenosine(37)-C2)-methylthiotransferase MiaB [Candidatus Staskawiczbacteria bacterium RIFOXYB1_FULL_32_11]|nr:MAG: tRNA (N6-isopentenyl adenosine(37)-C2)-methylthiotransferase MiaB [Candidatus Staskawiczbacteria bacterium RIFOXYB1_FULL_32_11]
MKKYHLIVFGCQMNISDAERVSAVLSKAGYKETKNQTGADIIVVTMCSIRQSAVDRVHWLAEKFRKIKRAHKLQTTNYPLQTILTGCILEKDKKIFIEGFDYVIDIKNISKLTQILNQNKKITLLKSNDRIICEESNYLDIEPKHSSKFSASVPIMTGCNNFCAYCVVPYTREREISRKAKDIITEVKKLVKNGYKEIWLLGQNVNSYKDTEKGINFAELLKIINKIPGDFWIRYTSSHPKDFKQDVIEAMADLPTEASAKAGGNHITPYLNLPVQSGDDKVLKSMKRWYTIEQYKKIITDLRKKIPNIPISTDIIIGFPGEIKKQFNNTVKLFKDIKYDMAYINKYSPRAGTSAFKLKDNISWQEKKRREKVLTDVLRETAFENNRKLIGKIVRVLIDSQKNGIFYGKSDTYKSVRITPISYSRELEIGQFVNVKIIKADNWNLEGDIYETAK